MGTFRVSIEVGDPAGQRYETVEALVDTGATYTTLPAPRLHGPGRVPHARDTFVLADSRRVERDIRCSERTRLKNCGSRPIRWGIG